MSFSCSVSAWNSLTSQLLRLHAPKRPHVHGWAFGVEEPTTLCIRLRYIVFCHIYDTKKLCYNWIPHATQAYLAYANVFDIQGYLHPPPSWWPSSFEVVLVLPGHPIACIWTIISFSLIIYMFEASLCNCILHCTKHIIYFMLKK
jgi:hypothetical protein